jgi:hypothetical protein
MEHDTLWVNLGRQGYLDVTKRVGLNFPTMQQLSWGTNSLDFDSDGRLDLFVSSGHINNNEGSTIPYAMPAQLFHNVASPGDSRKLDAAVDLLWQDVQFSEVSAEAGAYFSRPHVGRGSAVADFDNDGDMDIAVTHHHENVALLRNDTERAGDAIGFRFVGKSSNRSAVGTRVTLRVVGLGSDRRRIVREIIGGGSYLSADARQILTGVGAGAAAISAEIRWPSGEIREYDGLNAGGYYTVCEHEPTILFEPFREVNDGR